MLKAATVLDKLRLPLRFFGIHHQPSGTPEWFALAFQSKAHVPPYNDWVRNAHNSGDRKANFNTYCEHLRRILTEAPQIIDTNARDHSEVNRVIEFLAASCNQFGLILRNPKATAQLRNKKISRLIVKQGRSIQLHECIVADLTLEEGASVSLTLINCWIKKLVIQSDTLALLNIQGGGVDEVYCPRPTDKNPFTGSARISYFKLSNDFSNTQAYRNLRHHLLAMHNLEAAAVFQSAEMNASFHHQPIVEKIFNILYRISADYGNSTLRPLLWFSAFSVSNILLFWFTDGALPSFENVEDIGWRNEFVGNEDGKVALRAALITITQILNPLGIFGRGFLVPASTSLAVSNLVLCFAATVSLAFFILAIRRRFKISA